MSKKIEKLITNLGAETVVFAGHTYALRYSKNVIIKGSKIPTIIGKIEKSSGAFGAFIIPEAGSKNTTVAQEFSYRKTVSYLNRLIKHGMRIVRKCEKLGVEVPSPIGQYLFLFTPAEAEHLVMEGVTAAFAIRCKVVYNTADVEKIIAWKDLPEEWIRVLKDYT